MPFLQSRGLAIPFLALKSSESSCSSELTEDEFEEQDSVLWHSRARSWSPFSLAALCLTLMLFSGLWFLGRSRIQPIQSDGSLLDPGETEKGLVIASYSVQNVSWMTLVPSESVALTPPFDSSALTRSHLW